MSDVKSNVYIESTIVSYLVARPTRDALRNGQIELTRQWWLDAPNRFALYSSSLVMDECSMGDPVAAAERIAVLATLPNLDTSDEAEQLAAMLLSRMALPPKANRDALHVAIAVTNGVDFLLTWNCRHLANAMLRTRIEQVCREGGFEPPVICTPLELQEVRP